MAKLAFLVCLLLLSVLALVSADFYSDADIRYGADRVKITENGNLLQLTLDKESGAGIQSKQDYLYGLFEIQMKVVPGNSAGTVTSFFLSSEGPTHDRSAQDEIDFELLGNVTGEPYVVHTNVYTRGTGNREQQFYLWFDPRQDFHTYSVLWNQQQIIFYVDGTPIRLFKNAESMGVPYLKDQPLKIYCSLWSADEWATRGGRDKTDWSQAPFVAWYRYLKADACVASGGSSTCPSSKGQWWDQSLDSDGSQKLNWVRQNYLINDYCHDTAKYPQGFPPECSISP